MGQLSFIKHGNVHRDVLQGKVAVVTGAGRGIGRETARILAYLGASVVIAEISDEGRNTEQAIADEGGKALYVQTDVSDPESMLNMDLQCRQTLGEVDIVVNNAALTPTGPLLELPLELWDRVFEVNLRGAFLAVKAFLPSMLTRGYGVIVMMESADGTPFIAPYLASKAGLRSLSSSLALEIGDSKGVSSYCFGPGLVSTPGQARAFEDLAPRYGLSTEELVQATGANIISPELCATGLVGTILHASELHGQEASYMDGLVKLGLSASGERMQTQPEQQKPIQVTRHVEPDSHDILRLNQELEQILHANIQEYDTLTMFQRPFVKRMFQQGTGMKVEDWLANAELMTTLLQASLDDGHSLRDFVGHDRILSYIQQLRRMSTFIRKQDSDARGWIRDREQLQIALEALEVRRSTVDRLADALSVEIGKR